MKIYSLITAFVFACVTSGLCQHLSAAQINSLGKSVVKIKVPLQGGKQKIATGFIYSSREFAVTAYHAVSGASHVIVRYENSLVERSGTVVKIYKFADLALIRISNPFDVSPLSVSPATAVTNQDLTALGYYLDAVSMDQRRLSVSSSNPLKNILASKNITEVQDNGCPGLDLNVHKLQDNPLLPGLSGCPIFNGQGQVVGIGDGGLENGAYSISWAIPANHITTLMSMPESSSGSTIQSTVYFSADIIATAEQRTLDIAGLHFLKLRTRSLTDIATASATDDLTGLHQMIATFPPAIDKTRIMFDIYQEATSGAVMVIPANMNMSIVGNSVRITDSRNRHESLITVQPGLNELQVQQASVQFESAFAGVSLSWAPDFQFTYLSARQADGLTVRRKAFVGWLGGVSPQNYLFEAFAYKNGTLLSAANKKKNYDNAFLINRNTCVGSNFTPPGCDDMLEDLTIWGSMTVAVHLTSFSI